MRLFKQSFPAARTALIYITVGALTVIWAGVWYVYLNNNPPAGQSAYYWCTGFLVTGLTLALIGLGLGLIGRAAQRADLPPAEVPLTVVNPQLNATAPVPVPAPLTNNLTSPVVASTGQPVLAPPQENSPG